MKFMNPKNGFTIIEVLIASAIISITIFTVMSAAQKGIQLSYRSLKNTQANFLLEEGAEAVKTIRDGDWDNISSLGLDVPLYLAFDTTKNTWSFLDSSLNPNPIETKDGVFTRKVIFSAVNRDGNDDINQTVNNIDVNSKRVEVIVSWNEQGILRSKSLDFYIFDIFNE